MCLHVGLRVCLCLLEERNLCLFVFVRGKKRGKIVLMFVCVCDPRTLTLVTPRNPLTPACFWCPTPGQHKSALLQPQVGPSLPLLPLCGHSLADNTDFLLTRTVARVILHHVLLLPPLIRAGKLNQSDILDKPVYSGLNTLYLWCMNSFFFLMMMMTMF